jgi:hypothetical protein
LRSLTNREIYLIEFPSCKGVQVHIKGYQLEKRLLFEVKGVGYAESYEDHEHIYFVRDLEGLSLVETGLDSH